MRLKGKLLTIGLAGGLAATFAAWSTARAQSDASAPPPQHMRMYEQMGPGPMAPDDTMDFVGFEGRFGGKTVTGAPFTADFSVQMTRVLADGNQIRHTATGTVARDSQGRTRRDVTLPAIGAWAAEGKTPPHMISLRDPVAGVQYMLDPERKIARKMPIEKQPWRAHRRADAPPFSQERQSEETKTDLGTKVINGVSAQGTRITRTIPAGRIGNEKPIEIVLEKWYSPELQMDVKTTRSDPRMGTIVYELTNIQRTQPPAALFEVPSDYTVEEGRGMGMRRARRHGRRQPPSGETPEQAPPTPPAPPAAPAPQAPQN